MRVHRLQSIDVASYQVHVNRCLTTQSDKSKLMKDPYKIVFTSTSYAPGRLPSLVELHTD